MFQIKSDYLKMRVEYLWSHFHSIIKKEYGKFIDKHPECDFHGYLPFIKIKFCVRETEKYERLIVSDLKIPERERQTIKTVKETTTYPLPKKRKIHNTNLETKLTTTCDDQKEVETQLKVVNNLINSYDVVRVYDVIETQIMYDKISEDPLPIDVIFEDDDEDYYIKKMKPILMKSVECQTNNDNIILVTENESKEHQVTCLNEICDKYQYVIEKNSLSVYLKEFNIKLNSMLKGRCR